MSRKKKDIIVSGIYTSTAKGFGFVRAEGMEKDIYIPAENALSAFYGDTVEVRLKPSFRSGPAGKGHAEGEVIRITERGIRSLVGTYQRTRSMCYVIPDNQKIPFDITIKKENAGKAVTGQKVVASLLDYGSVRKNPEGKVTEILGRLNEPGVDILAIVKGLHIPTEFPEEVLKKADEIPGKIDEKETASRTDLRDIRTVTIDGADTKDIDDAISLETSPKGYTLGVHIADVSQYVREGTALDREASLRGTSVYLADRVIPMLPVPLSNGICSLNPGEDRLALSCIMELDRKGNLKDYRIVETVIRSDAKLTYTGVTELLQEGNTEEIEAEVRNQGSRRVRGRTGEIVSMLKKMQRLGNILHKRRNERGAVDFDFPETKIILNQKGFPVDIRPYERNEAMDLIEDFMLLANETVAQHAFWLSLPFVYRSHGAPEEEKILQLIKFVKNYGFKLKAGNGEVHPREIRQLLLSLRGTREEGMLARMVLRSMQRASYTTVCDGHFGLSLKYYCHFTSPIRRYPDLQIHRILKDYIHGKIDGGRQHYLEEILPGVAAHSSDMERRADEAERETEKLKKAQYMTEHLGEIFDGVISGVTSWGLYVTLPNTVEGLVHISSLKGDYFTFLEKNAVLVGEKTGISYSLGDRMTVMAAAADPVARTVDFVPAPTEEEQKKRTESPKAKKTRRRKNDR